MNTSKSLTVKNNLPNEPMRYTKRLGSTTYTVNVYISQTSRETMQDKVFRLVKNEAEDAISDNLFLKNPDFCGNIKLLQTVRLPGGSL